MTYRGNMQTTTEQIHDERQAAIAERARMEAEIAFEDELLAAEQRGREFLKALIGKDVPIVRAREHA